MWHAAKTSPTMRSEYPDQAGDKCGIMRPGHPTPCGRSIQTKWEIRRGGKQGRQMWHNAAQASRGRQAGDTMLPRLSEGDKWETRRGDKCGTMWPRDWEGQNWETRRGEKWRAERKREDNGKIMRPDHPTLSKGVRTPYWETDLGVELKSYPKLFVFMLANCPDCIGI